MPWITDTNGDKKYNPSIYAKEELPTWAEIYEEFYKKRYFENRTVNPDDPRWNDEDPYWKIPRYQYLLTMVCNQFNKMLFEDDFKRTLIKEITDRGILSTRYPNYAIWDIRFTCNQLCQIGDEIMESLRSLYMGLPYPPPIYSIPHPEGRVNPFVTDYHRIYVTDINYPIIFRPIIGLIPEGSGGNIIFDWVKELDKVLRPDLRDKVIYEPLPYGPTKSDFDTILEVMMGQFRSYFEGEDIGWKDENGNLIMNDNGAPMKCPSGFDPAM